MDEFNAEIREPAPHQPGGKQTPKVPDQQLAESPTGSANAGREENGFSYSVLRSLHFPQVNKINLHIFGSKAAIEKERARQKNIGKWVVHPLSPLRHYYVRFILLLTVANLFSVPLELAFSEEAEGVVYDLWLAFNLFSDTLFAVDVGLNFRVGILKDDSEVAILDLKVIRNKYLKTWFIPDVLSSLSFDLIIILMKVYHQSITATVAAGKILRIVMFVRVLSVIRLLRLQKLVRFYLEFERISDENLVKFNIFFRIVQMWLAMFLISHWNGCMQYFLSYLEGFPTDCWVVRENLLNATVGEKYSLCVFRGLSHMITISYGSDYLPTNENEMWIVMTSVLFGVLMYAMLACNVAAMITNLDGPQKAYKSKLDQVEEYMNYRKLPKALRLRIIEYYQARYGGKWFDNDILSLVSKSLKEEILTATCGQLLRNSPLFQNCDVNFINAILPKLQYEVFLEKDIIIYQSAPIDRMFFIKHGEVIVETESFQKQLCDGDYFGEIALLTRGKRLALVRALSTCHVFSLSGNNFRQVLQEFPDAMMEIEKTWQGDLGDSPEGMNVACLFFIKDAGM